MAINAKRRTRGIRPARPTVPVLEYIKRGDGFLYVTHYKDGDPVHLTAGQAKYPLLQVAIETAAQRAARLAPPVQESPAPAPAPAVPAAAQAAPGPAAVPAANTAKS